MKRLSIIILLSALLLGSFCGAEAAKASSHQPLDSTAAQPAPPKHHVMKDLKHYLAKVQPLLDKYGYAAVFVAVLVEGCGIPAPGQTLLMAGSIAAANSELSIVWLLLVTAFAALLGNSIGYLLGRSGGQAILRKLKVNEKRLERVENLFSRYGGGVILVARFVDGLRQLNGITAGLLEMRWWHFSIYNVLGAILWTCFWGLGLYYLDENIYAFHRVFMHLATWLAIAVIMAFVVLIVYLIYHRDAKTKK